ncbi:MAG: NifB/NifX family molybdenum-iron cluster-binding protein [archaeon]
MRLCIPTDGDGGLGAPVAQHFGRCGTYTLYDTGTAEVKVFPNTSSHMGGTGLPPEIIKRTGADVLVCRELGPRALQLLCGMGVAVYVGAMGTAKDAIESFKQGMLESASLQNVCEEHRSR